MSDLGAILSQTIDAEMGVLGALLIEETIAGEIIPKLDKSYFSSRTNQLIFEAISQLFLANKPIDAISVQEQLKKTGAFSQITGGEKYLLELMTNIYTAGNATYYAEVVREKGIMRLLMNAAQQIIEYTKDWQLELEALLDKAQQLIFEITQKKTGNEPAAMHDVLGPLIDQILKGKREFKGVRTGFADLDQMTNGFANSSLNIIAGRPSMGKTSFALNIATYTAIEQGAGVLIFSLEMSKEQLAQNMVCARAQVDAHQIGTEAFQPEDAEKITQEASSLMQANLFIDDTPGLTLLELRGKARRYKAKYQIGLIILDYIQLMESPQKNMENRQQEISQISRGLKSIARELDIPIVALSQLNRSVDARDDHRPRMSDLRESGALEQDADLILFLYRDEYYNKNSNKQGIAEVIIAKHRNGPTGSIELYFFKQHMRFSSISRQVYHG